MAAATITVTVYLAFWVPYYLSTVAAFCNVFDCEPDWDRVNYWVSKGVKVRL